MEHTLLLICAALAVGLVKGGLGPVPGALLVPLLSLTMPVSDAVAMTLPMLLVGDWVALPVYWRAWDARALRLMLPAAVIGVLTGALLLASLPDDTLRRVLGVFTLVAVGYKLGSTRLSALAYSPRDWHGWLAGFGSGFGSALANVGAPPITAYLLLRGLAPVPFIGTTVAFFLVVNMLKLPTFLATGVLQLDAAVSNAWVLPLIPLGVLGGKTLLKRIDAVRFEQMMLALLFVVGLMLLVN